MKKNIKNIAWFFVIAFGFLLFQMALAQPTDAPYVPPPTGFTGPVASPEDAISLLRKIFQWFAIIFWLLSVAAIFYAAFKYVTSGGDPEAIKKANSILLYAIIGIAVGLLAYGLPAFVERFLQARA
jgi:magnesium-transporting ATPase (P-type)